MPREPKKYLYHVMTGKVRTTENFRVRKMAEYEALENVIKRLIEGVNGVSKGMQNSKWCWLLIIRSYR